MRLLARLAVWIVARDVVAAVDDATRVRLTVMTGTAIIEGLLDERERATTSPIARSPVVHIVAK